MRMSRAISGAMRAAWAVIQQNRWRSLLTLTICGLGTGGVIIAGAFGQAHMSELEKRLNALGGRLVVVSPNKLPPSTGLLHFAGAGRCRGDSRADFVLGQGASRELNPEGVEPGEIILLGGQPYEVIGVMQPQGVNFAGEDEDHQAFIPLETYRQKIANRFWLSYLYLQLSPQADAERTVGQVQRLLRERHNRRTDQVDDVIVRDMADVSAQQTGLLATALWVVSVSSSLLLLLGVVGIATLMLQVVRQRRAEIGLRRALGATPFDVALQFFMEGMGLAVAGVMAGLLLGLLGTWVGQELITSAVAVQLPLLVIAVVVSLLAGGMACLAPAMVAARLEPAAALRS